MVNIACAWLIYHRFPNEWPAQDDNLGLADEFERADKARHLEDSIFYLYLAPPNNLISGISRGQPVHQLIFAGEFFSQVGNFCDFRIPGADLVENVTDIDDHHIFVVLVPYQEFDFQFLKIDGKLEKVRQYIPKNRDLSSVTDEELVQIMNKLNYRPR